MQTNHQRQGRDSSSGRLALELDSEGRRQEGTPEVGLGLERTAPDDRRRKHLVHWVAGSLRSLAILFRFKLIQGQVHHFRHLRKGLSRFLREFGYTGSSATALLEKSQALFGGTAESAQKSQQAFFVFRFLDLANETSRL